MLNELVETKQKWYREPWPWALFGIPAATMIAGVITISLAIRSEDGLVADDYYKQGLAINQTLARDDSAKRLGLHASVSLEDGRLLLYVICNPGVVLPSSLRMHWAHPTHSGSDQVLILNKDGDRYAIALPQMPAGRWNVSVEDLQGDWRIVGSLPMPFSGRLEISAVQ